MAASINRRLLTMTNEEHVDLFKGGLKMLLNFITTAIDILNDNMKGTIGLYYGCLLYTSPSPRDRQKSRMPSSA